MNDQQVTQKLSASEYWAMEWHKVFAIVYRVIRGQPMQSNDAVRLAVDATNEIVGREQARH